MRIQLTRSLSPAVAAKVGITHLRAMEGSNHEVDEDVFVQLGSLAVSLEPKSPPKAKSDSRRFAPQDGVPSPPEITGK